jgi:uncharacterized protein DUF6510
MTAMRDEDLWLDGNAIAGLLAEAFGAEMTAAPRRCQSCATVSPVGAHRLHRGAGLVLRCPACGDVGLLVGMLPDQLVLVLRGTWTVGVRRA